MRIRPSKIGAPVFSRAAAWREISCYTGGLAAKPPKLRMSEPCAGVLRVNIVLAELLTG